MSTPTTSNKNSVKSKVATTTTATPSSTSSTNGGVAWSMAEKQKCQKAVELYGMDDINSKISKIVAAIGSRTETEVRAHLRNIDGMKKVERDLTTVASTGGDAGQAVSGPTKGLATPAGAAADGGCGAQSEKKGENSIVNSTPTGGTGTNDSGDTPSVIGTPEKTPRKGRGKKPPPRAMLTVPNTMFDAKKMLFEPL
mmetsp:Transcript_7794/g.9729  ORF Transcript_7794/g.9729 Transcript_7794/m.9729 type:complete len:197 (+) Transcript_7794:85-675(+)